MNTATVICDNPGVTGTPPIGNRAKAASESSGDEPQQRFADVLPLAQAAMEKTSNDGREDKTPLKARSAKEQTVAESSGNTGRPVRRRGETAGADPQVTAWPFGGVVQPLIPRQASSGSADGQTVKAAAGPQAAEATTSGRVQKAIEQTSAAQGGVGAGSVPVRTQQQAQVVQQTPATEQPVKARSVAAAASNGTTPHGQETASASSAVTVGRQVPVTAQQVSREVGTEPAVQTAAATAAVRVGRFDVRTERAQAAAVSGVVSPASQGNTKPDATATVNTGVGALSAVTAEKTGQTPAKAQPANSQQEANPDVAARSGKNASDLAAAAEGRPDNAAKSAAAVRGDSSKAEPAQAATKDAGVPGVKDAGAAMAEFRVTPSGESATTAPHVAAPTQGQTSVDASAARTPVQSVGEQILDSIRSSGTPGDREVFIRLTPPELGTVLVRFQERGENLVGTLEVSTRKAQREIEQALPEMVRSLQEAGVQIRRIEVVTSDQPERNLGGEHQSQDVWQQRQEAGQGREHSSASSQTRWSQGMAERDAVRQGTSGEESQTAATPGRIDVLL